MRFLSYIESTGTQYLDTGFKPNSNTRLVIDFDVTAASAQCALFGSRTAYASNGYNVFTAANNAGYQDDYGTASKTASGVTSSGRHILDKNKNVLYVDGTAFNTSTAQSFTGTASIFLLSINNGGTALTAYPTTAKIYSCRIYDNDAMVRDFVPAENDDGMIGLYDKVNAEFYGNVGTGAFIGGEPLNEMFSVNFTALTNDRTYYTRVYPMNPKGYAQAEIGTQVGSAVPMAGILLSDLPIGSFISWKVNGATKKFTVVQQGLPSALYDDSCDGTWLMMQDLYETRIWDSTNANYAASDIHEYLNGTFLGLWDSAVVPLIKEVKIPYMNGTGYQSHLASGADGLSAKVFLLSAYELGWDTNYSTYFPADGACLSYFVGMPYQDDKRKAYLSGASKDWWTRSPHMNNTDYVWCVYSGHGGSTSKQSKTTGIGVRPTVILKSDARVGLEPNADGSYSLL